MDLQFTEAEQAFRAEARAWLEANVPAEALASHDTAEGFAQHVLWDKQLYAAGWAVVSMSRLKVTVKVTASAPTMVASGSLAVERTTSQTKG